MTNASVRRFARKAQMLLSMGFFVALSVVAGFYGEVASAAPVDEPNVATGMYEYLELARANTFRVYARSTGGVDETIHFTVKAGERAGVTALADSSIAELCAVVDITAPDDSPLTGVRKSGVEYNGTTTFTDLPASGGASTCNSSDRAHRTLTLSYTVPASSTFSGMNDAYKVTFRGNGAGGSTRLLDGAQGYEWRVAVSTHPTDPTIGRQSGRVWFVGDSVGLKVWQNNEQQELTTNATNHTFRFVRIDGYRYSVEYTNYHGIWSNFHGGLYGVRQEPTTNPITPAYRSYDHTDNDDNYGYTVTNLNRSYVFVDCGTTVNCPQQIPANILRNEPITNDTSEPVDLRNPIAQADNSPTAPSSNFRYTSYGSGNLAGGVVDVPYRHMQTGYIRLTVMRNSSPTPLCQRDYIVDDADGQGVVSWDFTQDSSCGAGNTLTTSFVANIPSTEGLTITAQAKHLGEMHFIDVDTEVRGGIEVTGNGLEISGTNSNKWLGWYDPFSRYTADSCGVIPPRIGPGAPGAGISGLGGGDLTDTSSGNNKLNWDSTSSENEYAYGAGQYPTVDGSIIPRFRAQWSLSTYESTNSNIPYRGLNRKAVDSTGGVHGWGSAPNCDADGLNNDDGYSKANGTASTESTWGNDRVIEDWTYAFEDPEPRTLVIGGLAYVLTPGMTASNTTVGVGETVTFTSSVSSPVTSNPTNWAIRRIVIPLGASLNTAARNPSNPGDYDCSYYMAMPSVTCTLEDSGTTTFTSGLLSPLVPPYPETPTSVGMQICYELVLNSFTQAIQPNFGSARECVVVGKYPGLTVLNGDVRVGGSFPSVGACRLPYDYDAANWRSYSVRMHDYGATSTRSSLGQYAAFTPGRISDYGSQGFLANNPLSTRLLFGTGGFQLYPPNDHGFYLGNPTGFTALTKVSYCLPDVNRLYAVSAAPATIMGGSSRVEATVNALPTESNFNFSGNNGTLVIGNAAGTGATLGLGQRVVIRVTQSSGSAGNSIRIKGPILYQQTGYSSISQIPQFVIVADGTIDIHFDHAQDNTAMEVNGVYSTRGNIYTCDSIYGVSSDAITTDTCKDAPLVVKGALITGGQVLPYRTAGFEGPGLPVYAETFDLTLETLLGDYMRARSGGALTTDYQSELPPRL